MLRLLEGPVEGLITVLRIEEKAQHPAGIELTASLI